jgi:tetratricopeptide (TPR) repeat protein
MVAAQSVDDLFAEANTLYKQGNYLAAVETYQKIEAENVVSSALYYNLGNCYYKLNKVAPTIYNYEKALLIDPLNEDASNNLVFAKRLTLDTIEDLPRSFLQKMNANFLQKLSYNEWAKGAIIFSFLAALFFLLFYFSRISARKRSYFIVSILGFLCLILTVFITINQYQQTKNTLEAIIFSEEVTVKNAPTINSEDVFTLHEGTKVWVLDAVDNWNKIKIADGKVGWIATKNIKKLTFF